MSGEHMHMHTQMALQMRRELARIARRDAFAAFQLDLTSGFCRLARLLNFTFLLLLLLFSPGQQQISPYLWAMYVFKYEESHKRGECGGVFFIGLCMF